MLTDLLLGALVFLLVGGTIAAAGILIAEFTGDNRRTLLRLRGLAGATEVESSAPGWRQGLMTRLSAVVSAIQKSQGTEMRTRLLRAGYLRPSAPAVFLVVRLLLAVVLPLLAVALLYWLGRPSLMKSLSPWAAYLLTALVACNAGLLGPAWWLATQVKKRQRVLRESLPDALDMLVLCLEGGVGFNAAVQRVTDELQPVHPILAGELVIVQHEILLGLSAGEALRKFSDRCGLADVRDLSQVLLQSEKYGASLTKALRTYADSARIQRQQQTEEQAQKTAVKILFPTLLCIFPAIFIVLLGPAAFQIAKLFAR